MISNAQISPGAITDGKVSNQAKIKASKLQKVSAGQILVGGADGKLAPVTLSGDLSVNSEGVATVTTSSSSTTTSTSSSSMTASEIKSVLGVQGEVVDTLGTQIIQQKTISGGSF
jgi:hypothetical protein|tara:strand:+ start:154 stop:498 length:345 start_codon:yes stop_codon:yes gene_type:complete